MTLLAASVLRVPSFLFLSAVISPSSIFSFASISGSLALSISLSVHSPCTLSPVWERWHGWQRQSANVQLKKWPPCPAAAQLGSCESIMANCSLPAKHTCSTTHWVRRLLNSVRPVLHFLYKQHRECPACIWCILPLIFTLTNFNILC